MVAGAILLLYLAAIAVGLRVKDLSGLATLGWFRPAPRPATWHAPLQREMPTDAGGERIRRGALLFNETPLYAGSHARARLSCASCHVQGGTQPFASPVVGMAALFPMFNDRAGRMISLEDRIEECFVRSENGRPIDYDGEEMQALVSYMAWLSPPRGSKAPLQGRGLVALPDLKPDPGHGATIYAMQCAGCHGENGEGRAPLFPPLWGANSFNDGAGMHGVKKMAAFVQHNMPQNRMGILTPQEAYDISAFIHQQPRPTFDQAYKQY